MSSLLLTDCLDEIFENLQDDEITLYSCLLVNRHWCETSVKILWRDVWRVNSYRRQSQAIVNTLIVFPMNPKSFYTRMELHLLQNHPYLIMQDFVKFFQLMILVEWFAIF